jgi:hypothetical protein
LRRRCFTPPIWQPTPKPRQEMKKEGQNKEDKANKKTQEEM